MKVNIVVVTRLTKSQPLPQYHLVLSKGNTHLQSLCLRHLESSNLCRIHQFSLAPYQLNQVIQLVMEVVLKDFNHYNRDKKLLPAEFKFEFPNKYFNEGEGKQGINFVSLSIPWLDLSTIWRQIYYEIPTYKKEPKLISLELLERINCHFKTCIGIYLNDLIINRFASPCFIIQAVGKIKFLPTFPIKVYIQLLSLLCLLST
ncbi:hypothetical protein K502DRAFT_322418 [Neoconidiobolus thromboides FSU 785]|nr:hypothetical protein K502DRAFT_322418 [Neoconidiobolus thromboides FSU 785]